MTTIKSARIGNMTVTSEVRMGRINATVVHTIRDASGWWKNVEVRRIDTNRLVNRFETEDDRNWEWLGCEFEPGLA